jgi:hypothetical protein
MIPSWSVQSRRQIVWWHPSEELSTTTLASEGKAAQEWVRKVKLAMKASGDENHERRQNYHVHWVTNRIARSPAH